MTAPLRLIVFDVDGTLVDSQVDILAAMSAAFAALDLPMPPRDTVLGIVGLSLDVAMARLAPGLGAAGHAELAGAYKGAYADLRAGGDVAQTSPFYPHARTTLDALSRRPENILGVATGKSRRGLDALLGGHGLDGVFTTVQVADHHPSKPHPAMLHAAMDEAGVTPDSAVMIGDTSYDMDMARAAGVRAIGVGWGYHGPARLTGADHLLDDFRELPGLLDRIWGAQT
ncbi:HAD-IA family hydrolase [Sediminimonas sp.]|uniref:HAD-IA family hydrolase n=1 Tax=Sediminimonas sp. TaxID=2823379 RepID=UPI0025E06444|nr:HAD-IA family hydrolase [Sediminimonas sp.]